MNSASTLGLSDAVPLYVRWNPDRSPYAVEFKLDLVSRITAELQEAERLGIEIGGMLLGTPPGSESPVLRVDDVVMIARRFEDGALYVLDPSQRQRIQEILAAAKPQGRVGVGFFRSHLRPGIFQPSIADKSLLSEQFSQGVYMFLLIQSREPRTAAFFISANGQLPDQPSARKFFFDDSEFKFLPEVSGTELDTNAAQLVEPRSSSDEAKYRWLAFASVFALALALIAGAFSGGILRMFRPPSNKMDLSVVSTGYVLKISWDHNAPFVSRAHGAQILIHDGNSRRELRLGHDELTSGEVDYQNQTKHVEISFILDSPDGNLPIQTYDWSE